LKKKKKDASTVAQNLTKLLNNMNRTYSKSQIDNIFKALGEQIAGDECDKLKDLYEAAAYSNPDDIQFDDNISDVNDTFVKYAKTLMRKYSK
jgi:hypothetical protein